MLFEESEKWRRGQCSVARFDGTIFRAMMRVVYLASTTDTDRKQKEKRKRKEEEQRTEDDRRGKKGTIKRKQWCWIKWLDSYVFTYVHTSVRAYLFLNSPTRFAGMLNSFFTLSGSWTYGCTFQSMLYLI